MLLKDVLLKVVEAARVQFSIENIMQQQMERIPINRPVYILALGKAAYPMAKVFLSNVQSDSFIKFQEGLVITPSGYASEPLNKVTIVEASHPLPDENSIKAADAAIEFLSRIKEDDILFILLSGGGSSLMEKPIDGFSLEDIQSKTEEMLKDGSSIDIINAIRKKFSAVKGGKMLKNIKSKFIYIYAMSDVPGDNPRHISSNPFLPQIEMIDDERHIEAHHRFDNLTTRKFNVKDKSIIYKIVANNHSFCEAIRDSALGIFPNLRRNNIHLISTYISGESSKTGREIADLASFIIKQKGRGFSAFVTPCLLIFGGETTVKVIGNGAGGRCTELALSTVEGLSKLSNCAILTYTSDGKDGNCEAAGAVIDCNTKNAMLDKGIDIEKYLDNNDSYTALKAVDAIIPSEPTDINVNDVVLLYVH